MYLLTPKTLTSIIHLESIIRIAAHLALNVICLRGRQATFQMSELVSTNVFQRLFLPAHSKHMKMSSTNSQVLLAPDV